MKGNSLEHISICVQIILKAACIFTSWESLTVVWKKTQPSSARNLGSVSDNVFWTPTELRDLTYKCTYEDDGTIYSKLFQRIQLESHLCGNKRVWVGQCGFESWQPHILALGTWACFRLSEPTSNPRPPHGIMRIRGTNPLKRTIWYKSTYKLSSAIFLLLLLL